MTDSAIQQDDQGFFDAVLQGGDLLADDSLRPAVLACLFTDKRATAEQLQDAGMDPDDPRGWWGDALNDDPSDQWGSWLWLLSRRKLTPDIVADAKSYAEDALAILVRIGAASSVTASPFLDASNELILPIAIVKPDGSTEAYRFAKLWQNTFAATPG